MADEYPRLSHTEAEAMWLALRRDLDERHLDGRMLHGTTRVLERLSKHMERVIAWWEGEHEQED